MTTETMEQSIVDALPGQEDVIKAIVGFHLREALVAARRVVERENGNVTLRGALLGYPSGRVGQFMDDDALRTIGLMLRWPLTTPQPNDLLQIASKLQAKIREILRSMPEAQVLSLNGLDVTVTQVGVLGGHRATIRQTTT